MNFIEDAPNEIRIGINQKITQDHRQTGNEVYLNKV